MNSFPQLLKRLWHYISPRRRIQFGVLLLLMVFASFAEIVSIGAVLPFLGVLTSPERVFENPLGQFFAQMLGATVPQQLLLPFTVAFAVAAVFSGFMRLLLLWVQTRLSHAIGADFSISIYSRTLYQPYAVHVARNSSEIISGISNKANGLVNGILMPVSSMLSSSLILITIVFALVAIEPFVACVAFIGFSSIYALVIFVTKKRLTLDGQCISREQNQIIKALQEGLSAIRDVLIDGSQAIYCKVYREADLPLRRAMANVQIISSSPRFIIEALSMVLIAVLAYFLAARSAGFSAAIPVLGTLVFGAQRLLPIMQQIYSSLAFIQAGKAPLSEALELLDQPLPEYVNLPLPEPIQFNDHIALNKLSFRYADQAPWVLQGLELVIPKGGRIGFIGSTGSGKSTLLDVIMGLLCPVEGHLLIDGIAITSQNQRAWQMRIAHVPQVIFLADISIAENIAFGIPRDQIDYDRVRLAAQKAQIAESIESWENQYGTLVGERGVRLSGGQRQRIGIARALYKQADVIVLDEATSALDNKTERVVMEAIENLSDELTVLIVAHRLTTLKKCTQIVELSNGHVKRTGSYAELIGYS